jgi:hypothetical protein
MLFVAYVDTPVVMQQCQLTAADHCGTQRCGKQQQLVHWYQCKEYACTCRGAPHRNDSSLGDGAHQFGFLRISDLRQLLLEQAQHVVFELQLVLSLVVLSLKSAVVADQLAGRTGGRVVDCLCSIQRLPQLQQKGT